MSQLRILSSTEQVAEHLRALLLRGHWSETIPGANRLGTELGVDSKIVEGALRQLEQENLLKGQGPRRKRLIVPPSGGVVLSSLRVAILLHDRGTQREIDYGGDLHHSLEEAGYSVVYPAKTLFELKMDVKRIERLVEQTAADVWVVCIGSTEVLEWFSARPEPSFALFGRHAGLPMAGLAYDMSPALVTATHQLIELGHHRIVILVRKLHRLPEPGPSARAFLDELEAHGIPTSTYNLPDWEESKSGFYEILNALFRVTPPTALIIDESLFFAATKQFLISRRIRVPEEVSLICLSSNHVFDWCVPSIAHIQVDARPVVRAVKRWLAAVSKGQRNVRQTHYPAEFFPGGTIGPAPND